MLDTLKTTFICPRCDRTYFQISRVEFNRDEAKYLELAAKAKRNHQCPWMRGKKKS